MNEEARSAKIFTRRAFVVGALQASALAALSARLGWLQIAQGRRYQRLSDKNRINVKMVPPSRGQIVDRFGVPLAVNNQNFRVLVIPEQTDDLEKALRGLQRLISLSEDKIQNVLDQAKKTAKYAPLEIKDDLNWDEVATIEVNLPDLPGLSIDVGELRNYPQSESTAHIIGYVGLANQNEAGEDPLLSLPGFKTGKTGLEKKFDAQLRGEAGTAEVEVNVIGREVRELSRKPSVPGQRVILSLDGELQRYAQERLIKERSASAIIMDAHTGAIYALASHPSFDPNLFTRGISANLWEELLGDSSHPLTNKAVAGQYPPASTFKMITALAGLQAGKITPERSVFCSGQFSFGSGLFHCWKKGGHGTVNVVDALMMSCDTFFYEMGAEMGIEAIAATARAMGLGGKFDFDLPEERPGLVPDKNWKAAYYGHAWQPGETIVSAIGQGYLQATPLQLAVMTARMVNGGHAVRPWLAGYVGETAMTKADWPGMGLDEAHLKLIKLGTDRVVNDSRGTAFGSRIQAAGMAMGGKTGTAQVRRITKQMRAEGVRNEDLPWQFRHHGLFTGYAPLEAPRYVCTVVVEHGVGGAVSAAPIARDLLLETQKRNPEKSPLQIQNEKSTDGKA